MNQENKNTNIWSRVSKALDRSQYIPKKAEDVQVRKTSSLKGKTVYVLKNPHAKTYLTLSERQYFIWGLIDGRTPLMDVAVDYCYNYQSFKIETILELIDDLYRNSLLSEKPVEVYKRLERTLKERKFFHRLKNLIFRLFSIDISSAIFSKIITPIARIMYFPLVSKIAKIITLLISVTGLYFIIPLIQSDSWAILNINNSYIDGILILLISNLVISFIVSLGQAGFILSQEGKLEWAGIKFRCAVPSINIDTADCAMFSSRERLIFHLYTIVLNAGLGGLCALLIKFVINDSFWSAAFYTGAFVGYIRAILLVSPLFSSPFYKFLVELVSINDLRSRAKGFLQRRLTKRFMFQGAFDQEENTYFFYLLMCIAWVL